MEVPNQDSGHRVVEPVRTVLVASDGPQAQGPNRTYEEGAWASDGAEEEVVVAVVAVRRWKHHSSVPCSSLAQHKGGTVVGPCACAVLVEHNELDSTRAEGEEDKVQHFAAEKSVAAVDHAEGWRNSTNYLVVQVQRRREVAVDGAEWEEPLDDMP